MDYNERIRILGTTVSAFLRRYHRPDHLDDATAAQTIRDISDSLNARFSASLNRDGLAERAERILRRVRETHRGRDWPTEPVFLKALDETETKVGRDVSPTWKPDSAIVATKRMAAGEPVGVTWLWGRGAAEILHRGLMREEDLEPYRAELIRSVRSVYGDEICDRQVALWTARHEAGMELGPMKPGEN